MPPFEPTRLSLAVMLLGTAAAAQPAPDAAPPPASIPEAPLAPDGLEGALKNGTVKLNVNARLEFADFDTPADTGFAPTVRTRLGYETGTIGGLTGYLEFENVASVHDDEYNSTQNGNADKPIIADVEVTEVNQAWIAYAGEDPDAFGAKLGRQVIALDDHRFIGHVGWRQDQQTFDAVRFTSDLGVEGLEATAGYITQVNRIFGEGADFDSESFFVNAGYDLDGGPRLTGFVYALDFDNAAANSSLTIGVRATGKHTLDEGGGALVYAASVATQSDYADNPASYDALYYAVDLGWATPEDGTIGLGYEVLGSDDGNAAFSTPLATLHKFNGFADVFLTTPNAGLTDLYAYYALPLPEESKSTARLIGHLFQTDDGGNDLGWELDAVATRKLTDHVTLGGKIAYFNGEDLGPFDRTRVTLDLTYAF